MFICKWNKKKKKMPTTTQTGFVTPIGVYFSIILSLQSDGPECVEGRFQGEFYSSTRILLLIRYRLFAITVEIKQRKTAVSGNLKQPARAFGRFQCLFFGSFYP